MANRLECSHCGEAEGNGSLSQRNTGETEVALALGQSTLAQPTRPPSNSPCLIFTLKFYEVYFHPGTVQFLRSDATQDSGSAPRWPPARPGPVTLLQRVLKTIEIAEAWNQNWQVSLAAERATQRHPGYGYWWLSSLNRKSHCVDVRGNWVQTTAHRAPWLSLGLFLRSILIRCRTVSAISSD